MSTAAAAIRDERDLPLRKAKVLQVNCEDEQRVVKASQIYLENSGENEGETFVRS